MPPSPDEHGGLLPRFSRGERWVHRSLALLMVVCIGTAALLYVDPLSALVGRRDLVATVHYVSGLFLPLPLVVGAAASPAFRADLRRLNRFVPDDWRWLRARDRRSGRIPVGKFNAGQKLNSAFVLGAVLVLLATGLMLRYFSVLPDDLRTGATFVHDLFAVALVVVTTGHLWLASNDPEARRGLRTGAVSPEWAQQEHGTWAAELAGTTGPPAARDDGAEPGP